MKSHARIKWMRTLGNLCYMLGVAFLIAAMAVNALPAPRVLAAQAAIWTTANTCQNPDPQDQNIYTYPSTVHIRGSNFPGNGLTIEWKITGQPGSNDPSTIVAG